MDMFICFNWKVIDDCQIDMLIGLSQGIFVDGWVN